MVMNPSNRACLNGLRVLDLTDESGHFAGRILADLGAEVLKIEPPGGDPVRRRGPFWADERHPDRGAQWLARNLGKRSQILNFATAEGAGVLRELARDADVLIESSAPGTMQGLGVGESALREANPRLIVCSITPYGQTGPRSKLRGSDLTILAASGNLFMTGDPDRPPVRCSLPVSHFHGGAEAAIAILMALSHRDRTGRGQHVDVSLQEVMLMANMTSPAQAWVTAVRGQRSGNFNRVGKTVQQEIWPCKDGYVTFALRGGPARIPGLIAITKYMDAEGMAPPALKDRDWTKYNHNTLTQEEVDAISEPFGAFFRTKTMQQLYEAACEHRLMLAPANTEREVLASRQLEARRFFELLSPPGRQGEELPIPARFAGCDLNQVRQAIPRLGATKGFDSGASFAAARQTPPPPGGKGIWNGLKILEFGAGAAAPIATRYFADQGATVVKIESRQRPDFLRTLRDDGSGKLDHSLFFACVNPNKLSAGLNLRDRRGIALARRFIGWADVVIENFAPGVMSKWGLDYEGLKVEHPELIMISTCLWGQTGPERAYPGFGGQGSALAGFNYLTGWPDREPLGPFGTITDSLSPRFATIAVAGALLRRERTGRGAYIDLSQVETGVYCLSEWLLAYGMTGESFGRIGNRSPYAAPHGVFPAAGEDRWVALAIHDDLDWSRLRAELGNPEWASKPALATLQGRLQNAEELERHLAEWTKEQQAEELAQRLQRAGLDAAVVEDMQDLKVDDQLAHREHFRKLGHPVLGEHVVEAAGMRFSESPMVFDRAAPCLAADNEGVYCGILGLSKNELDELVEAGILG
jgi:crotonobetainyl-CoA:carnitine CoA-transferase CaiB-like acyl-CoA transferase